MVRVVRRAFGTRRVGHTGTLDPAASGLLLVLVGPAVRLSRYLVGLPKVYRGAIRLGETTDTDDATGSVLSRSDSWKNLDAASIAAAMQRLTGVREQVPPAYSAKHVGGERAYRIARRGQPVQLAPVLVEIKRFELLSLEGPDVWFEAEVGSGTYLRSLARDLGAGLGCGAHLRELRRVQVGDFAVEDAFSLEAIRSGEARLISPLEALKHLPRIDIDPETARRVRLGQPLEGDRPGAGGGPVVLAQGEELVAVAEPKRGRLQPKVVLAS
ncbi:tRNA pseudouridine synthase B [bacterium HR33]|nr:tRNA pseudouridine synthase B [bacterium HR33]